MNTATELDALVADALTVTGAPPPDLFAEDSPALDPASPSAGADDHAAPYFVGLIGGKDVGKSSLVNALVGLPIARVTSHGRGTEAVTAYAHASAAPAVERLLAREAPGRFEIVTHDNPALGRQVLLDLPDIDSVYADHLEVTRRVLRHMLYPLWVQSVEKYADQQPQRWLARVAEGNDPTNFLFAINKVDLVTAREGASAAKELADDFARRVARTLHLSAAPKVFAIAATQPHAFDLPALREALSRQRTDGDIERSRQLAQRQRARSLLAWLGEQQLPERAARAARLYEEAADVVTERLTAPLLESATARLIDDGAYRARLTEPAIRTRLGRWPIVNAINAVLSPLLALAQRSIAPTAAADDPVDTLLSAAAPGEPALPQKIAATFAHVTRLHPDLPGLYQHNTLWTEPAALSAAAALRTRLRSAAAQQRQALVDRAGGRRWGLPGAAWRWLLTVGAILWFPIIQPVAEALLAGTLPKTFAAIAGLVVGVLSSTHLLRSTAFLILWFGVLWLLLRWQAAQKAERVLRHWISTESTDPTASLAAQVIAWTDDLLAPLRSRAEHLQRLAERERALRHDLNLPEQPPDTSNRAAA